MLQPVLCGSMIANYSNKNYDPSNQVIYLDKLKIYWICEGSVIFNEKFNRFDW